MLPEEVTKFIGQGGDVRIFEVEKGAIRKFADAINDRNPLYWDEEYARKSRYGAMVAPPGFFGWPTKWTGGSVFTSEATRELSDTLRKLGYGRGLAGGVECEFFQPIRAGDTLTATTVIKNIVEREGRTGKMVFIIRETTYTNQDDDLVAKERRIFIQR